MSRLIQLKRWLGLRKPTDMAIADSQPGQRLMTLEERMAFRRQMVFEAVREVLTEHGVSSKAFKLNVARLDSRGHRYAVMVDLLQLAGKITKHPGEWAIMESKMTAEAERRYRVKVASVYWRIEHGHIDVATVLPIEPAATAALVTQSTNGFPDTVLEDRHTGYSKNLGTDELCVFEQALLDGQDPQKPLRVGEKIYQTDFMPLV